jgi:hypothetical protein
MVIIKMNQEGLSESCDYQITEERNERKIKAERIETNQKPLDSLRADDCNGFGYFGPNNACLCAR